MCYKLFSCVPNFTNVALGRCLQAILCDVLLNWSKSFVLTTKRAWYFLLTFVAIVLNFIFVSKLLRAVVTVENYWIEPFSKMLAHSCGFVFLFARRTIRTSHTGFARYIFTMRTRTHRCVDYCFTNRAANIEAWLSNCLTKFYLDLTQSFVVLIIAYLFNFFVDWTHVLRFQLPF